MMRRLFLTLVVASSLFWAAPLFAGSYLNRAALLLDASEAERDMVLPRSDDKELVRMVYEVAQARTRAAQAMDVPRTIANAHPHLLLVLENTERAYAAALDGNHERFVEHILRARSEDQTFRAMVKELGYSLPSTR
jgi:hypothetical protein